MDSHPVNEYVKTLGTHPLEVGYFIYVDTLFTYSELNDYTNIFWRSFLKNYKWFELRSFSFSRLKDFSKGDSKKVLYSESMTLDSSTKSETRKLLSVWDISSKIGGAINIFVLVSASIFHTYSKECYQVDAINSLIVNHHEEKCAMK